MQGRVSVAVEHIEILVEEPSMEALLRELLPRIVPSLDFAIYPFQCKDELLSRLTDRLRGYARWLPDSFRVFIIVDRDSDECKQLKAILEQSASSVGLGTRSTPRDGRVSVVNRIAIEELEAWYFGDWNAIRAAYPRLPATIPTRAKYRDPDAIAGGTWEALERELRAVGYFKTGLRKIELARNVGANMDSGRNQSHSFRVFANAIAECVATPAS